MNGVSSTELAAVLTCLGILVIYHIFYFYIILCKTPDTTKLTNSYRNAFLWASKHHISHDAATSTLGLHILRNTILIGIFVGGNSFNIAFSYLNNFESMGSTATISGIRAIILSSFLFASFLSWAMVIRCASHLGYLLGASPHDDQDEEIDQSYIDRMETLANNMSYHFAIGFRFIFVSIPFALLGAGILLTSLQYTELNFT